METKPFNAIAAPSVELPPGYRYGVTRGADLVLQGAHPQRFDDLVRTLDEAAFPVAHMVEGGKGRSKITMAWDEALRARGWGKRNVSVKRIVDDEFVSSDRSHEIDMFAPRETGDAPYPGVACEMEWSNKDPFFDRDLNRFGVFHLEGIIDVGIVVTRGPDLQAAIKYAIPGTFNPKRGRFERKYGQSTTHWNKLEPRVERGGGGGCPLILIGIELARFDRPDRLCEVAESAERAIQKRDLDGLNAIHRSVADGDVF